MINEHTDWAEQKFGQSDLGDPRRTARLVKLASTLANEPGKPLVNITQSPADIEGAYRFIRNEHIDVNAMAEAGFQATVEQAQHHHLLLALEDTTTLIYKHSSIRDELGHVGRGKKQRGLLAHSVLLFAPDAKQKAPLPATAPTMSWAYLELAKLGGEGVQNSVSAYQMSNTLSKRPSK